MDCLLVQPPLAALFSSSLTSPYDVPRGLLCLASFLEQNNRAAKILPLDHYLAGKELGGRVGVEAKIRELLADHIRRYEPKVVAIGVSYTKQYPMGLRIAEYCKSVNPNIVAVVGGSHPSFFGERCFEDSNFLDAVVLGEGEWTLLDLVEAVNEGKALKDVRGIIYRKDGKVQRNRPREPGDLSELPVPNYELLPKSYLDRAKTICVLASRGCPSNCSFCVEPKFWGRKVRAVPLDRVLEEIELLSETYGVKTIGLEDSIFNMGNKYFTNLLRELSTREFNSEFYLQSRIDTLTDEGLSLIKSANISNIWLGIESASQKVLDTMNKGTTFEQATRACTKVKEKGLTCRTFWMVGHPGDNPREAETSMKGMESLLKSRLIDFCEIATFVPYPGTDFFANPKRYDMEILTYDWERYGRFNSYPVHRLKEFSEDEIYSTWAKMSVLYQRTILERDYNPS